VHLTEEHQALLRLLGKPYERWYRCLFTKMKGTVRNGGYMTASGSDKSAGMGAKTSEKKPFSSKEPHVADVA
jgi:hypothetical protein